jgi:hypothetical protein
MSFVPMLNLLNLISSRIAEGLQRWLRSGSWDGDSVVARGSRRRLVQIELRQLTPDPY